jgi:hypothetical protein
MGNAGRSQEAVNKDRFEHIMVLARRLSGENPATLPSFIRALGRTKQWRQITYILDRKLHDNIESLKPKDLFFSPFIPISPSGETLHSLLIALPQQRTFGLNSGLILPTPWHRQSLSNCLEHIGGSRNPWRQDSLNHRVVAWEPLGIEWVYGGNHSIATGIIKGEGEVQATETYNIRTADGAKIAPGKEVEFAAVFEIGRLLREAGA